MGFYFRKSVRVGPVRFNLSKSGVGVSAGVRGFRVGSGPRGSYIHAGTNGFYYRASLPSGGASQIVSPSGPGPDGPSDSAVLTEIESGSVVQMADSSAEALLKELNEKHQRHRFWPYVAVGTVVSYFALGWLGVAIGPLLTAAVAYWDQLRRTTVLLFDLEPEAQQRYQQLHDAFDQFAACGGTWHLEAEGKTQDRKRHAGASVTVRRKRIRLSKQAPTAIKTNIDTPTLPAGRQTLCFLPDRLLVFDSSGVGAVNYAALNVDVNTTNFIEAETPPTDATVVGHTWQFVNKSGGPDKRFKNNRQLPICLYEEVRLRTDSGLDEAFQVSRRQVGDLVRHSVRGQVARATVG